MKRLLPALLALALLASACSTFGRAPAATADGTEISSSSIDDEVAAIRSNDDYTSYLEQQYGQASAGTGGAGTFNSAFVAQVLQLRVWVGLLGDLVHDKGLEDELSAARKQFRDSVPSDFDSTFGTGTFAKFPKSIQTSIIDQFAVPQVVQDYVTAQVGDDPEAFFDDNPDEFTEICVSHVLVGLQGGRTPSEAQARAEALREQITSGDATFEEIASKESDDPTAAAQQGSLGCGSRSSLQFDPTFEDAAFALDEDEVSKPVLTQFGAHLILVTKRSTPKYADVQDQVPQVMQQAAQTRTRELIAKTICDADVSVNPRYGSWSTEGCDAAEPTLAHIEPPAGPQGSTSEQ